jgi:hypothetical protein
MRIFSRACILLLGIPEMAKLIEPRERELIINRPATRARDDCVRGFSRADSAFRAISRAETPARRRRAILGE